MQNLAHAFATKTVQEHQQIAKAFYHHLCDLFIEHIKAVTISSTALCKHVEIQQIEILEKYHQEGKSIILVSGHIGNWEWVAHALALQAPHILCAGYQPLHHQGIDRLAFHLRTRFQRQAIPHTALYRHMITYQGAPQALTLLIDQAPLDPITGYPTIFLGQATQVTLMAARLAKKCKQSILYMAIEKIQRGKYTARPILLATDATPLTVQEIAERYTRQIEDNILQNPALWLWSHRRWK